MHVPAGLFRSARINITTETNLTVDGDTQPDDRSSLQEYAPMACTDIRATDETDGPGVVVELVAFRCAAALSP